MNINRRMVYPAHKTSPKTTLYRLFDADGILLYVGISGNAARRFEEHQKDDEKQWSRFVARATMEHFDSRVDAFQAEKIAIRNERPLFNVMENESLAARFYAFARQSQLESRSWGELVANWKDLAGGWKDLYAETGSMVEELLSMVETLARKQYGDEYLRVRAEIAASKEPLEVT